MPLVISYHYDKEGSYYKDCADDLALQCKIFGLKHHIVQLKGDYSWIDAVRYKPYFIRDTMLRTRDDLLFIDADCHILRKPELNFDKWGVMLRADGTPHDFVHYIPNNHYSKELVSAWVDSVAGTEGGSHTALLKVLKDYKVIPPGYFGLGVSDNQSKRNYFNS